MISDTLTAAINVEVASRAVWLQMKVLTALRPACLYAMRMISIAELATNAKTKINIRNAWVMGSSVHDFGENMISSDVVPCDWLYLCVTSSTEVIAMSVVMIKTNKNCQDLFFYLNIRGKGRKPLRCR